MKKLISVLAFVAIGILGCLAQLKISTVDKVSPTDEVFMDMAVTAAQQAIASGQKAGGAVVIMNGAWKATGTPSADATPEENAIAKSRRTNLSGASVYTINQPTLAAMIALMKANVEAVYFVNPASDVIAAGIYTADDYDGTEQEVDSPVLIRLDYAPAAQLIK